MDTKVIVMKRNRVIKKRNPIAKALKFFTPKVIRDKTKYRRKDVKSTEKGAFGGGMEVNAQVVNGKCPFCTYQTVYLFLFIEPYLDACTCGWRPVEQKINGKISYMPLGGNIVLAKDPRSTQEWVKKDIYGVNTLS